MDTKLKRNYFKISIRILVFLLMTASLAVMALLPMDDNMIRLYLNNEIENEVLRDDFTQMGFLVENIYHEDGFNSETIDVKSGELKDYLDKGFRFFIFDEYENFVASDGLEPNHKSRRAISTETNWRTVNGRYIFKPTKIIDEYGNEKQEYYYVLCSATPKAVELYQDEINSVYQDTQKTINTFIVSSIVSSCVFVFSLILTCLLSGRKNQDGKIIFFKIDKIFNDLFLAAYVFFSIFYVLLYYDLNHVMYLEKNWSIVLTVFLAMILSLITTWVFTSISKRAKSGQLVRYTLIYRVYSIIKRAIISLFKWFFYTKIKRSIIFTGAIVAGFQFILLAFVSVLDYIEIIPLLLLSIISGGIFIVLLLVFLKGFEEIKNAISEIRHGKTPQSIEKIPTFKNEELQKVAEDLDNINDGIAEAVKTATTSERMKTELITNVSHDLKTPLTSIISYVELLGQEDLSAEAKDYIEILKQKSDRLKNIISDLFELSKSSSGNIEIIPETLGFKKLFEQTIGDMQDKISAQSREIRTIFPHDEIYIEADGKRLYRAVLNVIDNALKYSLDGTRIYIKLKSEGNKAIAEISNTSAYEMNFSENEIIERFSRADSSRSSEGSGLGLSIAKTFVEINGGKFNIAIDGDMFKAIFEFYIKNNQEEINEDFKENQ